MLRADGAVAPLAAAGGSAVVLAGLLAVLARLPRLPAFRGLELLLLAVGSGLGVAASITQLVPDVPDRTTPAQILTGAPLPPVPALSALLSTWQADPLWLTVCGALLAAYGLAALRATAWPVLRSASWVLGVLLLAWLTSGGLAVYQEVLLEAHLLQHIGLLLVVPVLLAGGAPLRLAGRSPGALVVTGSAVLRAVARPVVAAGLAVVAVLALYGTAVLRWSVSDVVGGEVSTAACLAVGALLVRALTGPGRSSSELDRSDESRSWWSRRPARRYWRSVRRCCSRTGSVRWAGGRTRSPRSTPQRVRPGCSPSSRSRCCWSRPCAVRPSPARRSLDAGRRPHESGARALAHPPRSRPSSMRSATRIRARCS